MIIALFVNTQKTPARNLALGVQEFLSQQGVTVVTEDEEAALIGAQPLLVLTPLKSALLFQWEVMAQS